jgi:antitoxin YefM
MEAYMRAIKAVVLRENFKDICSMVAAGETVIISRPRNKNVVLVSENDYNEMAKAKQNAEYLEKLDRSFRQLEEGKVVVKTLKELEAMAK